MCGFSLSVCCYSTWDCVQLSVKFMHHKIAQFICRLLYLRGLSKSNAEVSIFASLFDCHYPEKNGAYTELIGIDPEVMRIRSINCYI